MALRLRFLVLTLHDCHGVSRHNASRMAPLSVPGCLTMRDEHRRQSTKPSVWLCCCVFRLSVQGPLMAATSGLRSLIRRLSHGTFVVGSMHASMVDFNVAIEKTEPSRRRSIPGHCVNLTNCTPRPRLKSLPGPASWPRNDFLRSIHSNLAILPQNVYKVP